MTFLPLIAIVSSLGGFAGSYRHFKSKSRSSRVVGLSILGLLAAPTILFAVYYFHILPEKAWLYTLRSWPGSELLALFLGGAGGALATLLPRFLLIVPLGLTLATASLPYLKMTMSPLDARELREKWENDVCLQSTSSTCGPASAASILRFLNYPSSEREIATAAHTSSSGTEAWYLARYLRSRGLSAKFDFRDTFAPSIPLPAIVGVKIGAFGHFIAVLKISDGIVTLVDPLSGKRDVKLSDFMKEYSFTGFHLLIAKKDPQQITP